MADEAKVLAKDFAPYTDPGVTGQTNLENETKTTVAPDSVVAGTPPGNGSGLMHSGNPNIAANRGERAASLHDRDEFRELELSSRHQETSETT